MAMQALVAADQPLCDDVIRHDDVIDELFSRIEHQAQRTIALQAPVATDLRLVLCGLHVTLHLERMGDQCVNIAKLTKLTLELPLADKLLERFDTMGSQARLMIGEAMAAFGNRDVVRAEELVRLDQVINEENRSLARRILEVGGGLEAEREAGLRAILISRCLERIGDNAVDIGEQAVFLVTGEFREFTDASHPV